MSALRSFPFGEHYRAVIVADDGEPIRVKYERRTTDAMGDDAWIDATIESKSAISLPHALAAHVAQCVINEAYGEHKPAPAEKSAPPVSKLAAAQIMDEAYKTLNAIRADLATARREGDRLRAQALEESASAMTRVLSTMVDALGLSDLVAKE